MSNIFVFQSMPEPAVIFGEATPILLAKAAGAIAGSLISIAYVLPRGRREAMLRFTVGLVSGFVFGSTAGIRIADTLGVLGRISVVEVTLMGATFASLGAWWGLGVLKRVAEHASPDKLTNGLAKSLRQANDEPSKAAKDKRA